MTQADIEMATKFHRIKNLDAQLAELILRLGNGHSVKLEVVGTTYRAFHGINANQVIAQELGIFPSTMQGILAAYLRRNWDFNIVKTPQGDFVESRHYTHSPVPMHAPYPMIPTYVPKIMSASEAIEKYFRPIQVLDDEIKTIIHCFGGGYMPIHVVSKEYNRRRPGTTIDSTIADFLGIKSPRKGLTLPYLRKNSRFYVCWLKEVWQVC